MEPKIIREKIEQTELIKIIREGHYDEMAKLAVDVERRVLALGGEWHSEAQEVLVADGSEANDVWGANFYPWKEPRERIVYVSLINLKPALLHRKMEIRDPGLRKKIHDSITRFLLDDDETIPTE
ncbi:MAG: hypothetical protein G01um101448_361 [Parcubacteria group bacterium Gr01-1014_48]|nr:MAG: hypothetical protein Greene041614_247 [Parcubacteria group bacterium Greene0416_14]TSC74058.1 MAG: hypothetical protein G01um101448_361 [Parcubacteria group bacterium Gr01-1014_48]TSD01154.1 MAG: hypothetical protein Greene101415_457 [Parcubacteria group bacterium Greene1014_15]TSD08230.1 MAG: hypothetical protein Greene07144_300 [Parcubacteria group bacterium Greene0714_4]